MIVNRKARPARAVISPPQEKRPSGYTGFVPQPAIAMRGGQIVEPGDDDEPRFIDGYCELRGNGTSRPESS